MINTLKTGMTASLTSLKPLRSLAVEVSLHGGNPPLTTKPISPKIPVPACKLKKSNNLRPSLLLILSHCTVSKVPWIVVNRKIPASSDKILRIRINLEDWPLMYEILAKREVYTV